MSHRKTCAVIFLLLFGCKVGSSLGDAQELIVPSTFEEFRSLSTAEFDESWALFSVGELGTQHHVFLYRKGAEGKMSVTKSPVHVFEAPKQVSPNKLAEAMVAFETLGGMPEVSAPAIGGHRYQLIHLQMSGGQAKTTKQLLFDNPELTANGAAYSKAIAEIHKL